MAAIQRAKPEQAGHKHGIGIPHKVTGRRRRPTIGNVRGHGCSTPRLMDSLSKTRTVGLLLPSFDAESAVRQDVSLLVRREPSTRQSHFSNAIASVVAIVGICRWTPGTATEDR